MNEYDIVFVVLCYKNTKDIVSLLNNLREIHKKNRVIMVNSFYDEKSSHEFNRIADQYDCVFIPVENKGYGAGNNVGIRYALDHFQFKTLCICNPDIVFKNPETICNLSIKDNIIAPEIITKSGKQQNPYYSYNSSIIRRIKKAACKYNNKLLFYIAVALNKASNLYFRSTRHRNCETIFACHGSCFFIGYNALNVLFPLFNDEMFLFNEEEHLAKKADINNVKIIYNHTIHVFHKEDGSSDEIIRNNKEFELLCQSYRIMDKYWEGI